MIKLRYLFIVIIIVSCSKTKKEYYANGKLKKVQYESNNIYIVEDYDTLERIIYKSFLKNGVRDSLIKFNDNGTFKFKKKYLQSGIYSIEYDNNGNREQEGIYVDDTIKASWWRFYKDRKLNVMREYVIVCNDNYLNQVIYVNKNQDTIFKDNETFNKSTFIKLRKFNAKESIIISYHLQPYFTNSKLDLVFLKGGNCDEEADTIIQLTKNSGKLFLNKKYANSKGLFFEYNVSKQVNPSDGKYNIQHHKIYFDLSNKK